MPKSHLVGCCPLQAKVPDKQQPRKISSFVGKSYINRSCSSIFHDKLLAYWILRPFSTIVRLCLTCLSNYISRFVGWKVYRSQQDAASLGFLTSHPADSTVTYNPLNTYHIICVS